MTAAWGHGRDWREVIEVLSGWGGCSSAESVSSCDGAGGALPNGVVVVRDLLTKFSIRSGASCGVTFSTMVKLGSSRTSVGCSPCSCIWYSSGTGIFDADSLSRCNSM